MNCKKCKAEISPMDVFPGGICLACHKKIYDAIPLEKLGKPDFIGCITIKAGE